MKDTFVKPYDTFGVTPQHGRNYRDRRAPIPAVVTLMQIAQDLYRLTSADCSNEKCNRLQQQAMYVWAYSAACEHLQLGWSSALLHG